MGIPDEADSSTAHHRGPQVRFTGDEPPADWQTAAERYTRKQLEQPNRPDEGAILISSDEEVRDRSDFFSFLFCSLT